MNTCDKLKSITGRTDCYKDIDSKLVLNEFTVDAKVSSEFFSAKTYLENGKRMDSVFYQKTFQLSRTLATQYNYAVQKIVSDFSDRVWYNDQLVTEIANADYSSTIVSYDPQSQFSHVLNFDDFPDNIDPATTAGIVFQPLVLQF